MPFITRSIEYLHRRMSNAFIPVNEPVISDKRETQRGSLMCEGRVSVLATDRNPWLG